ncbi:hypothetical protein ZWY2020_027113 [Hordeum vulgare]|nr:hypothetical protein ZWY2020_027113 [Hordeum vulgare]
MSSSRRSSSASTPNPSSAAAPSAGPGAASPPLAASSSPTTPAFRIMDGDQSVLGVHHHHILALDHRTAAKAQLNTVARLDHYFYFYLGASCDGLLVLSRLARRVSGCCISICNPARREHASLAWPTRDFTALGMYLHRPTGEYRLLKSKLAAMSLRWAPTSHRGTSGGRT